MTERLAALLLVLIPDTDQEADLVLGPEAVADTRGHAAVAEGTPGQDPEVSAEAILALDPGVMAEGDLQDTIERIVTATTGAAADRQCHTGAVTWATGSILEQVVVWGCLV